MTMKKHIYFSDFGSWHAFQQKVGSWLAFQQKGGIKKREDYKHFGMHTLCENEIEQNGVSGAGDQYLYPAAGADSDDDQCRLRKMMTSASWERWWPEEDEKSNYFWIWGAHMQSRLEENKIKSWEYGFQEPNLFSGTTKSDGMEQRGGSKAEYQNLYPNAAPIFVQYLLLATPKLDLDCRILKCMWAPEICLRLTPQICLGFTFFRNICFGNASPLLKYGFKKNGNTRFLKFFVLGMHVSSWNPDF